MANSTFRALIVDRDATGNVVPTLRDMTDADLPEGDVVVRVAYSSLNYKDGLALTGAGNVIRSYPMVPGIDLAGVVESSETPKFKPGDRVVQTGWGNGETHWGGFTERTRLKSEYLLPLQQGVTLKQSMAIGTAGLTAMLCAMALHDGDCQPHSDDILVTGASGGVGSIAVAILAGAGYNVVASTGRSELNGYLQDLGAKRVIGRDEVIPPGDRPLDTQRWGGAVDTVGGVTLAGLLRSMKLWGVVASCGVAGGGQLQTTVFPFIMRGVSLVGIHCSETPEYRRLAAWNMLARDLPTHILDPITTTVKLDDLTKLADEILLGRIRGRTVVEIGGENV